MVIKKGDKVRVDYEGKLESGEIFDSSIHGDHSHPIEFEVGAGQMIPGFDSAVIGMEIGEETEIKIKPEEAYGEYNERLIQKVPLRKMPAGAKVEEGMILYIKTPDGHQLPVKVKKVSGDMVEIDMNHPLAGKTLIFKIIVKSVNEKGDFTDHHH